MAKIQQTHTATTNTNTTAKVLELLGLLSSVAFLAAVAQHVNHLNQVNHHLTAIYLSHTAMPGFAVRPDYQLVPLALITIVLLVVTAAMRKRFGSVLLVASAIFVSSGAVWLFGFHLARM